MGLSRQELDLVIKRCETRHERGKRVLWYQTWCRISWPALAVVLTALLLAVMFGWRTFWEGLAALAVLLITAMVALRIARDQTPDWQWLAYVDRQSGARGALLQYAEIGEYSARVPPRALDLSLPPAFPLRSVGVWIILIFGFFVWALLPISAGASGANTKPIPIPVQRLERLLAEMELADPDSATIEEVKRQLEELKESQGDGLERDDFEALKRMEEQLKASANAANDGAQRSLSKAQAEQAESLARDLQELSQQMQARPPSDSEMRQAENLNQQAQALLDQLQQRGAQSRAQREAQQGQEGEAGQGQQGQQGQQNQTGQQGGQGQEGQQGQQAQQGPQGQQAGANQGQQSTDSKGGQQGQQAQQGNGSQQGNPNSFNSDSVTQMQQRMQQYQQAMQQLAQQALADGAQISRGPGYAPLNYNNSGRSQNEKFKDQLFGLNAGDDAVTLGSGLSKRGEGAIEDDATSTREFSEGADTQYWNKKVLPRHRETLEQYFSDEAE